MRTELYQWMKSLAFFHVLTTALLHILPDKRYEQYIRLFMGLLLVLLICTPIFAVVGKSEELLSGFSNNYGREEQVRMKTEAEGIVDILSDDGKFKGLYYGKDESGNQTLFISFNAMKGGVISLGGTNNGNGQLKIYDADGNQISRLGYTGYVVLNKNTGKPMVSLNTAGLRLYTDYTDSENYNALMLGKYGLYAQKVQNNVPELWMEGDTSKKWEGYIARYLNNKVRINTNSLFTDGCELGANFSTDGSATIDKSLSVGGNTSGGCDCRTERTGTGLPGVL